MVEILRDGGKAPRIFPADNPASDSPHLLTRILTYSYLPVRNLWLLICPQWLSFDWSMGSVPLIERVLDFRNILTITFYLSASILIIRLLCSMDACNNSYNLMLSRICVKSQQNGYKTSVNGFQKKNGHCNSNSNPKNPQKSFTNFQFIGILKNSLERCLDSVLLRMCNLIPSEKNKSFCRVVERTDSANGSLINLYKRVNRVSNSVRGSTSRQEIFFSSTPFHPGILLVALSFLVFPFLPATNLLFYVGFVIAERILYIPSMGFCLLVALGNHCLGLRFRGIRGRRLMHLMTFLLTLSAFCWRTIERNRDWMSEESLYRSGVSVNPAKGNS